VTLRLANCTSNNKNETVSLDERFEIVSLTGTLSRHGAHLHVAVADFQGNVVGGHLMDGCEAGTLLKRNSHPNLLRCFGPLSSSHQVISAVFNARVVAVRYALLLMCERVNEQRVTHARN
jgi:hypothetical protein